MSEVAPPIQPGARIITHPASPSAKPATVPVVDPVSARQPKSRLEWFYIKTILSILGLLKQTLTAPKPTDRASKEDIARVDGFRTHADVRRARRLTLNLALDKIRAQWERNGKKGAVVLDLDETLLDNLNYYKRYKNYSPREWDDFLADNTNIGYFDETVTFLKELDMLGIPVYFVSGRNNSRLRRATEDMVTRLVKQHKLRNVRNIILKDDKTVDGVTYSSRDAKGNRIGKDDAYRWIQKQEGSILAVIGDQPTDAPNPRLLIPFFKVPHFYLLGKPDLWEAPAQPALQESQAYHPGAIWLTA